MRKKTHGLFLWAAMVAAFLSPLFPQARTVGLFQNDPGACPGYTLFCPMNSVTTYLIDNEGRLINSWQSDVLPGSAVYLLENGHLLHTGAIGNTRFTGADMGGRIQEYDWEGNLVWFYEYSGMGYYQHHDAIKLPNGNVVMVAWEYKTADQALSAGRNPSLLGAGNLWPDHLAEVKPQGLFGGEIVWEWHAWDHLIQNYDSSRANYGSPAGHPELINLNFIGPPANAMSADWLHVNSVAYNPEFDQLMLSVHSINEIWVIDHSTTLSEAAGHTGGKYGKGGDLLYRWGNARTYGAGVMADRKLHQQHCASWVPGGSPGAGHILIFNNGVGRPEGQYSSVDEIVPPADSLGNYARAAGSAFGPPAPAWSYTAPVPADFFASYISGAQRLPNGNTLICDGPHGIFFEVTPAKQTVWKYVNPVADNRALEFNEPIPGLSIRQENFVFRAYRYAIDFPGFSGKNMTPGDYIEKYPSGLAAGGSALPAGFGLLPIRPNPCNRFIVIPFVLTEQQEVTIQVFNTRGQEVARPADKVFPGGSHAVTLDGSPLRSGVYLCRLRAAGRTAEKPLAVVK